MRGPASRMEKEMLLEDKSIVITGGNSSVGKALARPAEIADVVFFASDRAG